MLGINGLLYIPNYISQEHHDYLLSKIDNEFWRSDLARRVQHYGYVYNYKERSIGKDSYLGLLPPYLARVARQLTYDGLVTHDLDQAIVNEYEQGQGIGDHIDCEPCFGNIIFSLSLLSPVVMDFKLKTNTENKKVSVILEPCSLCVLGGEARYLWTHGIAKRNIDEINGIVVPRSRRISVTFRKVILEE